MDGSYKIQVKIGDSEFLAEGGEETVKAAFKQFLEAIKSAVPARPTAAPDAPKNESSGDDKTSLPMERAEPPDRALLEQIFSKEGDLLSLRLLPPPDRKSRQADAAILLMYGYRALLQLQEVPVTKLTEGLRRSGISVTRLDRFIGVHTSLFMKGGTRIGGRYTLNNQGVRTAETWLRSWFH